MTRNNLTEQLRWLMLKKPADITGPHKPNATIVYTDPSTALPAITPLQTVQNDTAEDPHDVWKAAFDVEMAPLPNSTTHAQLDLKIPQTPREANDDCEVVDLTAELGQMATPSGKKIKSESNNKAPLSRKRKSDEFEEAKREPPDSDEGALNVLDDAIDNLAPPPPYSSVPPRKRQAVEAPDIDARHEADLFDFSNQNFDRRQAIRRQISIPAESPRETVASTATSDEKALLKQFFELAPRHVQSVESKLEESVRNLSAQVVDLYECSMDDEAETLTMEMSKLTATRHAMGKLVRAKDEMLRLLSRRDEQRERFRALVVQHASDQQAFKHARLANNAAIEELAAYENDCLALLAGCKDRIQQAVEQARTTEPSIKATQPSSREFTPIDVDSPPRIAQTQAQSPRRVKREIAGPARPVHTPVPRTTSSRTPFQQREITPANDYDDAEFDDIDELIDEDDAPARPATRPILGQLCDNVQRSYARVDTLKSPAPSKMPPPPGKGIVSKRSDIEEEGFKHPWSNDVKRTLRERFMHTGLRQGQLQAINATLAGKDVFVLMPTGGGKSLCYQLPSQINSGKTKGVTVVVSPLLSLMEDQVQHLRQLHIQAFLINGDTSAGERKTIWDALANRDVTKFVQILYITPEMLSKSQAMLNSLDKLYANDRFARLVIDEAHCVSQWGHDFRPDYKTIGSIRKKYPTVPIMALTATATENVKTDTIHNLGIDGCEIFTRSFNRPNLYYEVREKGRGKDVLASMADIIKIKHNKQTGIIYCLSRKNCEEIAQALRDNHNIRATHYHAGMRSDEKSKVQRDWQAGKWHVIVATIAFGMGIDKADVRFVIHHSIPKSLEGYYQETGRAGRDGGPSSCYLFFSFGDVSKLRQMIINGEDGSREQKDRQLAMLQKMVQYCDNKMDCRRAQVLRYFNEVFDKKLCKNTCDVCGSDVRFTMQDVTELANHAIEVVKAFDGGQVTLLKCVDAFRGGKTKGLAASDSFGAGASFDKANAERLFYSLIADGALEEYQVFNRSKFPIQYIKAADNARHVRHMELAMSLSPGKPKSRASAKNKRAEPTSTNVSSPIQGPASRKKKPKAPTLDEYRYDDRFTVPDEDDDYDDDAFEPFAVPKSRTAITSDGVLDGLSDIHRWAVESFVEEASEVARNLARQDSLHSALFPDPILRQMAIHWTETKLQMKRIDGISAVQVEHYGDRFCDLVKGAHANFKEMCGTKTAGTALNPNANVVDLCSDSELEGNDEDEEDDEDDYGSFDEFALNADDEDIIAQGTQDPEIEAFNARFLDSQSVAMRTQPKTRGGFKGGFRGKRQYRAVSGGSASRGRSKASSSRGGVKKSFRGGRSKAAAKPRLIGAMPT